MSKTVVALIVATLACGSASAYLWNELRVERDQAHTLQARIAELEQVRKTPPAEPIARNPFLPSPPRHPSPSEPAPVADKKAPEPKARASFTAMNAGGQAITASGMSLRNGQMDPEMRRRMQQSMEQQRRLLQDPEYRDLMRQQQKDGMQHMYGDLELMLGLSREEADRVLDVLAEQQVRSMEEQRPWMMDGSPPDEAAIRERQRTFADIKRKNDAELAQVLGSRFDEWQSYQQNMGARAQVTQLRQVLATSDEPLRQDQIKPLVAAIAREQQAQTTARMRAFQNGVPNAEAQLRMQEDWAQRQAETQQRIRDSVSSLLTPGQMQRLEEQHERERRSQEMQLRMQRARMKEAEARGEDPANANGMMISTPVGASQIGFVAGP